MPNHSYFWTSDPTYVLAVFASSLIAFHALFVWPIGVRFGLKPLNEIQWKQIDYVWVGLAALSLVTATAEVRKLQSSSFLNQTLRIGWGDGRLLLRSTIESRDIYCGSLSRHDIPPERVDEHIRQVRLTCEWFRQIVPLLEAEVKEPSQNEFEPPNPDSSISNSYSLDAITFTQDRISGYNQLKLRRSEYASSQERTPAEALLILLSPLLLAVAVALRLAKVSGEVGIARRKAELVKGGG